MRGSITFLDTLSHQMPGIFILNVNKCKEQTGFLALNTLHREMIAR
jgi:hypothetical protein